MHAAFRKEIIIQANSLQQFCTEWQTACHKIGASKIYLQLLVFRGFLHGQKENANLHIQSYRCSANDFAPRGTHFDLRAIFNDLNELVFSWASRVQRHTRRQNTAQRKLHFGTIREEDRVIRINPALDQPFVPLVSCYVLYHDAAFGQSRIKAVREPPASSHRRNSAAESAEFPHRRKRRWEERICRALR
jgi:hypothetical protein